MGMASPSGGEPHEAAQWNGLRLALTPSPGATGGLRRRSGAIQTCSLDILPLRDPGADPADGHHMTLQQRRKHLVDEWRIDELAFVQARNTAALQCGRWRSLPDSGPNHERERG